MELNDKRTMDLIRTLFRIWNRERNKKVFDIIDMISSDYEHDSWDNILDQLDKIKVILINGETQ